ncbi:lipoprotein signal peptidase [Actinobaculum suis]|uniref:Lipoprotein signal peptidase n=1 Tax=Actinobaculum suis TaxID=1657 RepID=A0A1B9BCC3_9ACTO|nr:signal peptidase II [Actinobaculum suis]OCA93302.1 signal peptidase II [Actinobaculum suis]OCA94455.1 signal peptidase II [Actinobaculum suis]VDG76734.1 lipoprotein signal peptidase [Actinobaculum suis]
MMKKTETASNEAEPAAAPKLAAPESAGTKPAEPEIAGTKPAEPETAGTKPAEPETAGTKPAGLDARLPQWLGVAVIALSIVIVDQITKRVALANLDPGERIPLLGDLFGLQLVFNPGAAFSMGAGATRVITVFALVVCVVVIPWLLSRPVGRLTRIAFALIWGGAIGNVIDRLFFPPGKLAGHVVDFLAYADWFVGNIADIAIVGGVVLLLIQAFRAENTETSNKLATADTPGTGELETSSKLDNASVPTTDKTEEATAAHVSETSTERRETEGCR